MKRLFAYGLVPILGILFFSFFQTALNGAETASDSTLTVGVGRVEITPDEPIRMTGYGGRRAPSEGVEGKLWAKALAIGEGEDAVLIVTMDLIGVPDWLKAQVVEELDMPESQIALCASHTHSGPHLKDVLNPIFMEDIPENHWAAILRYSEKLTGKVVAACRMALNNRQPGKLAWGEGEVGFAGNRRVLENGVWVGFGTQPDGPVDHAVPVMKVTDANGKMIAVLANYACHCTTLGGSMNRIHGDWAGETQRLLEEQHPGITAMIAIGCGADQNPNPRGGMDEVKQNSKLLADEVDRLLRTKLKSLEDVPQSTIDHISLPLDPLPSREEWMERAKSDERFSYFAKLELDRLDRGETLPTAIDYPIQTWTFGTDLAMVFLAGEVVVDYSIKLKQRFDKKRLWVNAYANAAPSYIASRRLYDEGGYEVDRSMMYYDKPNRLSPDTEELVLDEVLQQLPYPFYSEETLSRLPPPVTKDKALATMTAHPDVTVELVAAEPLVMDPIDVAWDAQGRMWVVEMADYPLGLDGKGKAGGRVRILEDANGDGNYEKSTLFLEGLHYPTSVLPWRDGALITAPPDLIFARDRNHDGTADEIKPLYTGFYVGNQQHLANGMQWGLDGWVYLANGDSGGEVHSWIHPEAVRIDNLDMRILPQAGLIETVLGRTQFGRNRDNWGNWFGNSNSWPGWHYALEDHYLERNPHISYPNAKVYLPEVPQAGPVYPLSKTLSRYNDYEKANRFTSASGYIIYEDEGLGEAFKGNSFVCESVHNLVSRGVVHREGASFASTRAPEERNAEFLTSTDNWFRPTAVRSGPDGALYVVDMYRYVIEHPEWVPQDWQRKLNLREGHDKGRIYRLSSKGKQLRKVPDLSKLEGEKLAAAMDVDNRWQRDTVQRLLLENPDAKSHPELEKIALKGRYPASRVQALWTLHCLEALKPETVMQALADSDPRMQQQAVRLAEPWLNSETNLAEKVLALSSTQDKPLTQQIAYTLGYIDSPAASEQLSQWLMEYAEDTLIRSALLSSLVPHLTRIADRGLSKLLNPGQKDVNEGIIQTAIGIGNVPAQEAILSSILTQQGERQFATFNLFLDSLRQGGHSLKALYQEANPALKDKLEKSALLFDEADAFARSASNNTSARLKALALLGYPDLTGKQDQERLLSFLDPTYPTEIQIASVKLLARSGGDSRTSLFMQAWDTTGPSVRKQMIESLLDRYDSSVELLEYTRGHTELIPLFSASQVAYLTSHRNTYLKDLAKSVFKTSVSEDRLQVIESFQPALSMEGNVSAGRNIFSARCAICHKVGDLGVDVGPDLTSLTDKSPESMLIAIADPNRAVEDKFALYTVTDQSGHEMAGIISQESANAITLVNAGGNEQTVLRSQIKQFGGGTLSLMPAGLELGMSHQDMADLITFITASSDSLKITNDADGSVTMPASAALVSGPSAFYNPDSSAVEFISDSDSLQWTVYDLKAGYYDIFTDASMAVDYTGRPFKLEMNDTFVTGTVRYSRDIKNFRKRKFGNILIEENLPKAVFTLSHKLDGPQMSLKELKLIPVK
ncbi:MAG: neutral/alkaline non-lysosomal ceramidase N-terminal domain-containing protein [Verrucomicrobiae bacterium]|nr:neutral/alkaline non-lysosomal ceramidase N-terminal domain-containing protein [Verrucomicrobiae bacterium]